MKTKTKIIIFRVSDSEHTEIMKRSRPFHSITNYIKTAIKEFSNKGHKEKVEGSVELISLYRELNMHLGHIGANLNQTVHRINELSKGGVDVTPIIINEIYPQLNDVRSLCVYLQKELLRITEKYRF